ncbi:hypothetical protein J5N97_019631 [Dioscorea zingiberensis]|uniref:Uncharacterized protein n=1 Tax=Dioscorea zingiberensis TaxID=325984 RepID=A0A9D5HCW5_9LILI|nr:hypothetical protein J5N97_019631 [Dioscorea zingiberensis]
MAELKAARPVDSGGVRCSSLVDSSKEDDFAEIFGGLEASCSIPFLELPVGIEDPDDAKVGEGRVVNDYEEIFGRFAGVNLGISCGEMTMPDDFSGRVPKKIIFGPQGVESSILSSQGSDGDLVACLEKDQTLLDSDPSNDRLKQFSMSHHKAVGRSIEQTTSDTKHVIQLNAILRHAFVAKACSSENSERDNVSQMAAYGLNPKRDSNETITSREQGKTSMPASKSIKNSMNDTNDLGQLNTNPPTSEDDFVNLKPHWSSSSCCSTSTGGISSPEVTYATASDISLQTQPLFVSPPSRPPPKVAYNHSRPEIKMFTNTKDDVCERGLLRKTNKSPKYWEGFSKGDTSQNSSRDSSPCFYDAEVDGSSAAVAAAAAADAAMKEAIKQAQVRLKIARASMDRNRDSFKGGKNLVKSDSINCKDEEAEVVKTFGEDITRITTAKEDEEMNRIIPQEMQKHWRATKIDSNHEEKESKAAEEEHALQGKKTKSSQSNLEERSGEWKIEKQAYDEKFKMVQQVSEQVNIEKEMIAKEDKDEQENKVGKIPFELKKTRKLWAVYESHELKNKIKLNADILPSREEEIREIISAIRGVHVHEKTMNMLGRAYDSSLEEETEEKPEEARMVYLGVEDEAKQIDIQKTSTDEICEKNLENFDHDCRYEKFHKFEEKNNNLETAKKVDRRQESKTKPYIASEPRESEKGRKLTNKTSVNLRRNLNCRTDPLSQKRWRN